MYRSHLADLGLLYISVVLFQELPSLPKLLAVFTSTTGLWFLTRGLSEINGGDLLTIITAMAFAAYILMADRYAKNNLDPYVLSFQQFLIVGGFSVIVALIFRFPFTVASPGTIGVILFLTLFPTLSAFVIQLVAHKHTAPVKVSLILAVEPIFAAVFACTLGGETFILSRAMGGVLVVLAIIVAEVPAQSWRLAPIASQTRA